MATENPYRLPRTVTPSRYELTLTPELASASFSGEEKVEVTISDTVSEIRLNAAELEIISAQLRGADGTSIDATASVDEESEVATIALASPAAPGDYVLTLTFSGTLNDKLRGFYRSTFKNEAGEEKVIATTQFEATDARRAFPCWDEPDFKAVFGVTLIVDEDLAAFSIAAETESTPLGNGKRQVEFADTMIMSTYLVAFVVGPLVTTDAVDVDGVPLRVACVPGREHLTAFALEAGAAALRFFSEYFKIDYPGGKLDLLALPDFAFGAMENLGCVTFRETALLVDPETASRLEVERVADVVAHEIAHMWFGDLVTMKWWNGIWLNEAFATFMELLFVDHFRPEWERWTSFGLSRSAAAGVDSLSSTRPIEFEVIRPEEAQGMFDLLTYEKGGAVLRMLEQHLGGHEFAVGIGAYLSKHAYGNAETTDLWDALEASSEQPVRAMMDSWIFQGGHPIVSAQLADDDVTLTLSQKRFRYLDDDGKALWQVPVGIRAMINDEWHNEKLILDGESTTITLPGKPDYVVVNERSHGFFRSAYKGELFDAIVANSHALDPLERFTLVTDTWNATLAGDVELEKAVHLLGLLHGDDDPNVWSAVLSALASLDKIASEEERPALQEFVRGITGPNHDWLGWEPRDGESERLATLRGLLISTLATLGNDTNVRAEAERRYAEYQEDPTTLDPNLVTAVLSSLAATNDVKHYESFLATFQSDNETPQAKVNALQTLALFTSDELVERTLKMVEDGDIRTQDAPYTVRIMLGRRASGAKVWDWVESHWEELMDKFPDNSISRMVDGITAQADPDLAKRVRAFFESHPVPQAQKTIDQSCERLLVNATFYERHNGKMKDLFVL